MISFLRRNIGEEAIQGEGRPVIVVTTDAINVEVRGPRMGNTGVEPEVGSECSMIRRGAINAAELESEASVVERRNGGADSTRRGIGLPGDVDPCVLEDGVAVDGNSSVIDAAERVEQKIRAPCREHGVARCMKAGRSDLGPHLVYDIEAPCIVENEVISYDLVDTGAIDCGHGRVGNDGAPGDVEEDAIRRSDAGEGPGSGSSSRRSEGGPSVGRHVENKDVTGCRCAAEDDDEIPESSDGGGGPGLWGIAKGCELARPRRCGFIVDMNIVGDSRGCESPKHHKLLPQSGHPRVNPWRRPRIDEVNLLAVDAAAPTGELTGP